MMFTPEKTVVTLANATVMNPIASHPAVSKIEKVAAKVDVTNGQARLMTMVIVTVCHLSMKSRNMKKMMPRKLIGSRMMLKVIQVIAQVKMMRYTRHTQLTMTPGRNCTRCRSNVVLVQIQIQTNEVVRADETMLVIKVPHVMATTRLVKSDAKKSIRKRNVLDAALAVGLAIGQAIEIAHIAEVVEEGEVLEVAAVVAVVAAAAVGDILISV